MYQRGWLLATLLLLLPWLGGCVERRFVITSDPMGAVVHDERGLPLGASPADKQFTYYGKYKFTLVKDGYQTQVIEENVRAPWYQWFGLDFISENLIPWTIRDVRYLHYTMQPQVAAPPEAVLNQAQNLRSTGQGAGQPTGPIQDPLRPPVALPPPQVNVGAPVP